MRAITTDRLLEIQTELSSSYMDLLGVKRVKTAYRFLAQHFLEWWLIKEGRRWYFYKFISQGYLLNSLANVGRFYVSCAEIPFVWSQCFFVMQLVVHTPNSTLLKVLERKTVLFGNLPTHLRMQELSFCSAQAYHSLKERVIKADPK